MAIYTQASPRDRFVARLRQQGVPDHVIEGIGMNVRDESSWNFGAVGDNGAALGAVQWNGPRARRLQQFAKSRGTQWNDPETQADYLVYEGQNHEKEGWQKTLSSPDAASAAVNFVNHYERPAENNRRRRAATYAGGSYSAGDETGSIAGPSLTNPNVYESGMGDIPQGRYIGKNGQPMIPPPSGRDRFVTGLEAVSESLSALGRGHAPTFQRTDRFIQQLALERGMRSGGFQGPTKADAKAAEDAAKLQAENLTKSEAAKQLAGMNRPDLVQAVLNGTYSPKEAMDAALKESVVPGRELSESQTAMALQFRKELDTKAAPLAQIELAAANIQKAADAAKNPNAGRAADSILVQQFAKLLDPTSVVREGEVAFVLNSMGGLESTLNELQSQLTGSGRLLPEQRQLLIDMSNQILGASRKQLKGYHDYYGGLAKAQGIDPKWIGWLPDQGAPTAVGAGAGQAALDGNTPAAAGAPAAARPGARFVPPPPPGTVVEDLD